jgi:hypothetical protein
LKTGKYPWNMHMTFSFNGQDIPCISQGNNAEKRERKEK